MGFTAWSRGEDSHQAVRLLSLIRLLRYSPLVDPDIFMYQIGKTRKNIKHLHVCIDYPRLFFFIIIIIVLHKWRSHLSMRLYNIRTILMAAHRCSTGVPLKSCARRAGAHRKYTINSKQDGYSEGHTVCQVI